MTYAEACNAAATDQGLDPIMADLKAAGIPTWLDQTGGFCMTVAVYLDEGHTRWIWITDAAEWHGGSPGMDALVCLYDMAHLEGCEPIQENDVPMDDVVATVRKIMRNA